MAMTEVLKEDHESVRTKLAFLESEHEPFPQKHAPSVLPVDGNVGHAPRKEMRRLQKRRRWWQGLLIVAAIGLIGVLVRSVVNGSQRQSAMASSVASWDAARWMTEKEAVAWPAESLDVLRHMLIQERDRVRPFDHFARSTLSFISGGAQIGHQDPVQTVLSIVAEPEHWQAAPLISVPSPGAREALGLYGGEATHASFDELMAVQELAHALLPIAVKEVWNHRLTPTDRDVLVVYARCLMLAQLFEQELCLIPSPSRAGRGWQFILDPQGYVADQEMGVKRAWAALLRAIHEGDPQAIVACSGRLTMILHNLQNQWEREIIRTGVRTLPVLPQ